MKKQKQKLKSNNAITLIALIITIIVLLILAMVSIKLVWDGGIIAHSKNATSKYTVEQEKELIALGYSEYKMAKIKDSSSVLNVEGASVTGINPWTLTFIETGNIYSLKENGEIEGPKKKTEDDMAMEKYVLGEDLKGQALSNIVNESDATMKPLNGENIELLNLGFYSYIKNEEEVSDIAIYAKYKNKAYIILADCVNESHFNENTTKSVAMIYEPKGREGQKVEYSIDGTEANKKEWTVLYDNRDNIEIISPESVGSLTLGDQDEEATGENHFEKAVDSYNNAIERINKYTRGLVSNTNKIAVRSVGSNPDSPNSRNTDKYTLERLESWTYSDNEKILTINGIGECSDKNYEQDLVRMSYWKVAGTGEDYWLASRHVRSDSDYISFTVNAIGSGGFTNGSTLWSAQYRGAGCNNTNSSVSSNSSSYAVRPIVKINK